jgi:rRNA maturation endonuclease Nob1
MGQDSRLGIDRLAKQLLRSFKAEAREREIQHFIRFIKHCSGCGRALI